MKSVVQSILGTYTPLTYLTPEGVEVPIAGLAGVDFDYLIGAVLFIICLWSVFRLIGVLLRG